MRIRWKLLILLLVISLLPLGAALWFGEAAARRLGEELAAGTREQLSSDAKRYLLQTVRDHGKLLRRGAETLAHNVRIQAGAVERSLAADPPDSPEIHFAADFETGGSLGELARSEKHVQTTADGRTIPMAVSYQHQSILLAPGVEEAEVAEDLARLSTMVPTYQLVYQSQSEFLHWQYVALESGVHSAFPGHGYYPDGFDPRRRPWYINARAGNALIWNPPIVDASTGHVMLTRSMPVYRPDGSFAGVTAIDIRMTDLVREIELPAEWACVARNMLVSPMEEGVTSRNVMHIVAQRDFESANQWDVPVTPPVLSSSDQEQLEGMFQDLMAERAAVRKMPFDGCDSLWAYGPMQGTGAALLAVVPYEHVIAPALAVEAQMLARVRHLRSVVLTILGVVLVIVVILSLLGSRHVTRPIQELVAAAQRIADGDLDTPTRVTTHDELGELGATVNAMLPQLRDRIKLKHSLTLAMEVQQHLLPDEPPHIEGLDVAGKSIYCDETGGDYYDFVDLSRINPHTLGVAVGDVTGHGIASALLMATSRSLLRSRAGEPGDLGTVLNHMNRHLAADVPVGKFMTLSFLLFDAQRKTVRWTSAGHDPVIVYTPASDSFSELAGGGIPLGIEPTWQFAEFGPQQLEAGQVIVVGTDGIWEARDPQERMFGKQRLRETIRAVAHGSARDISNAITNAVAEFRGVHSQDDDITLVVVKVA
ncbi:MAG: SpoIIE family protein phosphatase [Planctomycetes bacterium]|nr:SpoIIE family protein phosphatase [Planctomycetota bacterium]